MTLYDELQQVTSDARTAVRELNQVIERLEAGLPPNRLLPDAGNQDSPFISQAPDNTLIYTLRQTTPNTSDGKYQGLYRLPLASSDGKAVLIAPPSLPDLTARLRPPATPADPTPDFGSPLPFVDLDGACFNAMVLLSVAPFEFSLVIDICPPPQWCYTWDFTISDGGWVAGNAWADWSARYVAGEGWGTESERGVMQASLSLPFAATFTALSFDYIGTGSSVNYDGHSIQLYKDGAVLPPYAGNNDTHASGSASITIDPLVADKIVIGGNYSVPGFLNYRITRVTVRGTGINPFGPNNC